ncbi:MAG: glycogen debranching enzyme N-terminal domain-containing protein [Paludibacteraceae bacterium]|nr:glycogen debranching enzyme N-terminal domain-containing protein [Paludibacteraceae bacterium]
MNYLRFDRLLMTNLEKSLDKEMLRTNRAGAYSSGTIVDCNTRKYHGLLVVPVEKLGGNHVLLSSCDETIIQHGAEFNIGLHKYAGDYYSPRGHKYIREFRMGSVATTIYRIGGVILQKERILVSNESRVLVAYTLLEAHSATTLRLRPFLAFRSVNKLTEQNSVASTDYAEAENGVSFCMYEGYPNLVMQTNKQMQWVSEPNWYNGIEYSKEAERGYAFKEDLFVPGYFELSIKKGETVVFSAGTDAISPRKMKRLFEEEKETRMERSDFMACLKASADQFHNKLSDGSYLLAGCPWFDYRARDQFISLPGVTLYADKEKAFDEIMECASVALREFMNGEPSTTRLKEVDAPDVLLWAIWAIQQYAIKLGVDVAAEKYGQLVFDIVNYIRRQQHPNLSVHDNGLLYVKGTEKPATWMNAVENGWPITPRTGYVVEINALWYNALKFAAELATAQKNENQADLFDYQAGLSGNSLVAKFWNGTYLYDYVDGDYCNKEVRPNMLFAVSLPYSALDRKQQKSVVDIVTRELLTIKGLRSLSPKSGMYRPEYIGGELERDRNYHNGPIWPWTTASFVEAYLKVYKMSGVSFVMRIMAGFEPEMKELTLCTLSELYDGNPPFRGHGAMSFAMSVAEVIRAYTLMHNALCTMQNA